MYPRDVNRINYNNYYVGQNLDFLIRSKMRSESLSTPLTNTPVFYDDQVSSKMALLGKRGFYDPGYIYGFDNQQNERRENMNNQNNKSPHKYPPYNLNEREQYMNSQNQKDNISQEQFELEMRRRQELRNERDRNEINPEQLNNIRDNNYNMRNEPNQYDKDYHNEMKPQNFQEQNPKMNNYRNDEEFQREYNDYLNKELAEKEKYNTRQGNDQLNLPKTREQIQHDVYIENFKRQQLAKQMMMEDEMKYRQNLYK